VLFLTDFYRIFEKVSQIGEYCTYFKVMESTDIYLNVTKELIASLYYLLFTICIIHLSGIFL